MNYFALSVRIVGIIVIVIFTATKISHAHPNRPQAPALEITTDLTWSEDIRPIFRKKCMKGHSPAGICPWEFRLSA